MLEQVIITVHNNEGCTHLTLRWRGGALTDLDLDTPRYRPRIVRTDEDTIALAHRLAAHYPDSVIASILNRQGRKSAYGHRFTAQSGRLRTSRGRTLAAPPDLDQELGCRNDETLE